MLPGAGSSCQARPRLIADLCLPDAKVVLCIPHSALSLAQMQMKRPSGELEMPSTPPDLQLTSSRGRIVKPRTWEDGAEAPLALAGSRLQRTTTPKQELSSPDSDLPAISAGR